MATKGVSTLNRFVLQNSVGRLILAVAGLGLLGILTTALAGPSDDSDAKAKALARLDDDWSKMAAKRDLDGLLSFYAEDAIVYPPNQPVAKGREAAKKLWMSLLADPSASSSWKANHSEVSKSGEIGFTAGTYEFSIKAPDGKAMTEKGKYLCVWKQQKDGSWKVIHDMWNSDAK
jgi:ketosteroid isomerase-like protein